METAVKIYSSSILTPKIGFSCPAVSFPVEDKRSFLKGRILRARVKCAKGGSVPEVDKILNMEDELIGMSKLNDKCKETRGIVELMECLEREAIMGEDEGKDPTDYNRRAQIFDKSSRVFQALKPTH